MFADMVKFFFYDWLKHPSMCECNFFIDLWDSVSFGYRPRQKNVFSMFTNKTEDSFTSLSILKILICVLCLFLFAVHKCMSCTPTSSCSWMSQGFTCRTRCSIYLRHICWLAWLISSQIRHSTQGKQGEFIENSSKDMCTIIIVFIEMN